MTMHIHYDHQCPQCGTPYIPYGESVPCPRCGLVEGQRFDFLGPAADSARINLLERGAFTPGAWFVGDVSDNLLRHVFLALDFHRETRGESFEESAHSFFAQMDFGEHEFMRPYLVRLSTDVFATIVRTNGEEWETRIHTERQAAIVRAQTDNGRRSLPGSRGKQRLRESRHAGGVVQQPDGTWLVYSLDDGRRVLYQDTDATYILATQDGERLAFENVAKLVDHLNRETRE